MINLAEDHQPDCCGTQAAAGPSATSPQPFLEVAKPEVITQPHGNQVLPKSRLDAHQIHPRLTSQRSRVP